jgi:hypothetical protein
LADIVHLHDLGKESFANILLYLSALGGIIHWVGLLILVPSGNELAISRVPHPLRVAGSQQRTFSRWFTELIRIEVAGPTNPKTVQRHHQDFAHDQVSVCATKIMLVPHASVA